MHRLPEETQKILIHMQERHRSQRVASFVELNQRAEKNGILFIGDSITEAFPIHEILRSEQQKYNRGVGGDKTIDILNMLEVVVYSLIPAKIFLLIGTNDLGLGSKPQEIIEQIKEICSNIERNLSDTKLYVQSIYPVNQMLDDKLSSQTVGLRNNRDIQTINAAIREFVSNNHATYIDLYPKLVDNEGLLQADYTYDGLHLNIKGYEIVRDEIQKYL